MYGYGYHLRISGTVSALVITFYSYIVGSGSGYCGGSEGGAGEQ